MFVCLYFCFYYSRHKMYLFTNVRICVNSIILKGNEKAEILTSIANCSSLLRLWKNLNNFSGFPSWCWLFWCSHRCDTQKFTHLYIYIYIYIYTLLLYSKCQSSRPSVSLVFFFTPYHFFPSSPNTMHSQIFFLASSRRHYSTRLRH